MQHVWRRTLSARHLPAGSGLPAERKRWWNATDHRRGRPARYRRFQHAIGGARSTEYGAAATVRRGRRLRHRGFGGTEQRVVAYSWARRIRRGRHSAYGKCCGRTTERRVRSGSFQPAIIYAARNDRWRYTAAGTDLCGSRRWVQVRSGGFQRIVATTFHIAAQFECADLAGYVGAAC